MQDLFRNLLLLQIKPLASLSQLTLQVLNQCLGLVLAPHVSILLFLGEFCHLLRQGVTLLQVFLEETSKLLLRILDFEELVLLQFFGDLFNSGLLRFHLLLEEVELELL